MQILCRIDSHKFFAIYDLTVDERMSLLSSWSLAQDPVLLAESLPVPPVLLREQPVWRILRGASHVQLPVWTQPVSAAAALHRRGRSGLRCVCAGQPHSLWELQPGLCRDAGRLQAHGGRLHRELPGIWDGPPGSGAGLPAAESRPQAGGRVSGWPLVCCWSLSFSLNVRINCCLWCGRNN